MSDVRQVDVLVVGLGPAGASAARNAASSGLNVLAVDRKRTPGIPVQCAEFVPTMLSPTIDAVTSAKRQHIKQMHTVVEGARVEQNKHFPGVMLDRAKFDQRLVRYAVESGAQCRFACAITNVAETGVIKLNTGERILAKVIIGADGPRSKIGRAVGAVSGDLVVTRQITVPLLDYHEATDIFLSSQYCGGYAWLFPIGEFANLGIGVDPCCRNRLRPLLLDLHNQLCREGRLGRRALNKTGGAIPVGGMVAPTARLNGRLVLLCGDAAGLTNPVTGAGINAAVMSGSLAGDCAVDWCAGDAEADQEYYEDLTDLFGASLNRALRRRRELMDKFKHPVKPTVGELRRSWIAYPEYWAA